MTTMRLKTAFGTVLTGVALVAGGYLWMEATPAQERPPMAPGMARPDGMGPGMMRMGPPPTMTATDKYVYVLRGDTLYQFSTDGLKLLAKSELPRPEPHENQDAKGPPRK
jgi:hypothetical protein